MSNYSFETHLHRYSVWTAARAVQRNFTTTENIPAAIENSALPKFVENPIASQSDFDIWQSKTANELMKSLNCSFGRAAKIIGIYLKTAWVIRHPEEDCSSAVIHPPIDRILLTNLLIEKKLLDLRELIKLGWTRFDEKHYSDLMRIVRKNNLSFNWRLEEYWRFP